MRLNLNDIVGNIFYTDKKEQEKEENKINDTRTRSNTYLASNGYNPFLNKDGRLAYPYLNYQRALDNPNVSNTAKNYIQQATGLSPTETTSTQSSADTGVDRSTQSDANTNVDVNSLASMDVVTELPKLTESQIADIILNHFSNSTVITPADAAGIYNAQEQSGMSALAILAIGGLESGYGTSSIAKNTNNLWGWGATNDNPSGNAKSFSPISTGALEFANSFLNTYYNNYGAKSIYAAGTGNNPAGMGYSYYDNGSINPQWATDVGSIMGTFYKTAAGVTTPSGGTSYSAPATYSRATSYSAPVSYSGGTQSYSSAATSSGGQAATSTSGQTTTTTTNKDKPWRDKFPIGRSQAEDIARYGFAYPPDEYPKISVEEQKSRGIYPSGQYPLGEYVANVHGVTPGYNYKADNLGHCVWYVRGRAKQKLGADATWLGNGNMQCANAPAHTQVAVSIDNLRGDMFASFQKGTSAVGQYAGHVVYIEDVVGDYVYFTDGGRNSNAPEYNDVRYTGGRIRRSTKEDFMKGIDSETGRRFGTTLVGLADVTKFPGAMTVQQSSTASTSKSSSSTGKSSTKNVSKQQTQHEKDARSSSREMDAWNKSKSTSKSSSGNSSGGQSNTSTQMTQSEQDARRSSREIEEWKKSKK